MFKKFFSKKCEELEPITADQARKASQQTLKENLPIEKVLSVVEKHIQKATKKGKREVCIWNKDLFEKDFINLNDFYLIHLRESVCANLLSRGFKTNTQPISLFIYW